MKRTGAEPERPDDDEMLDEYDFSGGVRGKYYRALQQGYTITIHKEDGTTEVREVNPQGMVVLEPDVREYFPDSESVNRTLRSLITLIPMRKSIPRTRSGRATSGRKRA